VNESDLGRAVTLRTKADCSEEPLELGDLKGKWNYIADWHAAKREAVERVAEFTRVRLREVPFQSGSDVTERNDCVDDRDEVLQALTFFLQRAPATAVNLSMQWDRFHQEIVAVIDTSEFKKKQAVQP